MKVSLECSFALLAFLCTFQAPPSECHEFPGQFLNFRTKTLDNFNAARRLLGSGQLKPMINMINKLASGKVTIPEIGPAANMYKLKWSRKLEQDAMQLMDTKKEVPSPLISSFEHNGLIAFTWSGEITSILKEIFKSIPIDQVKSVLEKVMDVIDALIMALLLGWNYPKTLPVGDGVNLGATEALFAHRYEIGCHAKILYSTCLMEKSRNGGYLYEQGVPCSKCPTHCEFFEHPDGFIEEGDLCEPPGSAEHEKSAAAEAQSTFFITLIVLLVTATVNVF